MDQPGSDSEVTRSLGLLDNTNEFDDSSDADPSDSDMLPTGPLPPPKRRRKRRRAGQKPTSTRKKANPRKKRKARTRKRKKSEEKSSEDDSSDEVPLDPLDVPLQWLVDAVESGLPPVIPTFGEEAEEKKEEDDPGFRIVDVTFPIAVPVAGERRVLLNLLDPAANSDPSKPFKSVTMKGVVSRLGKAVDINDLSKKCAVGPSATLASFDRSAQHQSVLSSRAQINRYERDTMGWVQGHHDVGNLFPVVYFGGKVVNKARRKFRNIRIKRFIGRRSNGIALMTTGVTEFIGLVDHVHPSAKLQKRRDPVFVEKHEKMISLVRGLSATNFGDYSDEDDASYIAEVQSMGSTLPGVMVSRQEEALEILGDDCPKIVEALPYWQDNVIINLKKMIKLVGGLKHFKKLGKNTGFKPRCASDDLLAFIPAIRSRYGFTSAKIRTRLAEDSTVAHSDDQLPFFEALDDFKVVLAMDNDALDSAMCGSLSADILEPTFTPNARRFQQSFGLDGASMGIVITGGTASRFAECVTQLIQDIATTMVLFGMNTPRQLVGFISGSVAPLVGKASWRINLREFLDHIGGAGGIDPNQLSQTMNNTLAKRVNESLVELKASSTYYVLQGFSAANILTMVGTESTVKAMPTTAFKSMAKSLVTGDDKMTLDDATKLLAKTGISAHCGKPLLSQHLKQLKTHNKLTNDELLGMSDSFFAFIVKKSEEEFKTWTADLVSFVGRSLFLSFCKMGQTASRFDFLIPLFRTLAPILEANGFTKSSLLTMTHNTPTQVLDRFDEVVTKFQAATNKAQVKRLRDIFAKQGKRNLPAMLAEID
jgi:hypothetical protein